VKADRCTTCHCEKDLCLCPPVHAGVLELSTRWRRPMPQEVTRAVARYSRVTLQEIHGRSSAPVIVRARHLAMFMVRVDSGRSYPEIGSFFGRDHSTVIHAHGAIVGLRESGEPQVQLQIAIDIKAIRALIETMLEDSPEATRLREPLIPPPDCKLCELLREDLTQARQEIVRLQAELALRSANVPK